MADEQGMLERVQQEMEEALQAVRDRYTAFIEDYKQRMETDVDPSMHTAPPEYQDMRSPAEQDAYDEEVRQAEMERTAQEVMPIPDEQLPEAIPSPIMPDGSLVTPDQPPPSRNRKSLDNPYGK